MNKIFFELKAGAEEETVPERIRTSFNSTERDGQVGVKKKINYLTKKFKYKIKLIVNFFIYFNLFFIFFSLNLNFNERKNLFPRVQARRKG